MAGADGAEGRDEFARLLRSLKDRSGLSYGALAKRLHMSTSTLHRYCNGSAVPNDYAPAERLARLCRATPDELVELHRQWILADAYRGRRVEGGGGSGAGPGAGGGTGAGAPAAAGGVEEGAAVSPSDSVPPSASVSPSAESTSEPPLVGGAVPHPPEPPSAPAPAPDSSRTSSTSVPDKDSEPVVSDAQRTTAAAGAGRRRRTALIAAVAVAAALGAAALTVLPLGGHDDARGGPSAGAGAEAGASVSVSPSPPARGKDGRPSPSGSAGPRESAKAPDEDGNGDRDRDGEGPGKGDGAGATEGSAAPLNVATRPYVYENPCAQHFLVDSEPEQVGPPASEQDAQRWVAAYGAVSGGEQRVALTIQGTGDDTVVLESLRVRVVGKAEPLAWNDYSMGVGCGGDVQTKSFDIDLDAGSPVVTAKNGQGEFPYKVSESDPKVFYVSAHTVAHDVRWELTLTWSSGDRRGTVRVDDRGTPFRTSGNKGRPGYDYPLGGGEWIERSE